MIIVCFTTFIIISLEEVYTFFRQVIDEYEIGRPKALQSRK